MKRTSVLLLLLIFGIQSFTANTYYWIGGASGQWISANFKDAAGSNGLPTSTDNVIFGGPKVGSTTPNPQFGTVVVTEIPNNTEINGILVTFFDAGGGNFKGTDVSLQGLTDLCNFKIKYGGGTGNYKNFVYLQATPQEPPANGFGCILRLNTSDLTGPKRMNLIMEPQTKIQIDGQYGAYTAAQCRDGQLLVNLYPTCDENNNHPGLILQSLEGDGHAEIIQNTDANQAIYGFIQWFIIPYSTNPVPTTAIAHYIASPIYTDATISNLGDHCRQENCLCVFDQWPFGAGSNGDWVRLFDRSANNWGTFYGNHSCSDQVLNFDNANITPGTGINIFTYFNEKLFFGRFNNAIPGNEIVLPTSGMKDDGFALVGNPFPSGLNFNKNAGSEMLGWSWGQNIKTMIYYWDPTLGIAGDYRSYNWFTTDKSPASTGDKIPRGQGFFVEGDGTVNGTQRQLTVNNAARVFDVLENIKSTSDIKANTLYLNLFNIGRNIVTNTMTVSFADGSTMNYDRNDAIKMYNDANLCQIFGWTADNRPVSIKSLQPTTGTTTFPVHIKVSEGGNYRLDADQLGSFSTSAGIMLYDRKMNTSQDLKANPGYSFTTVAGDDEYRFDLMFSNILNGITDNQSGQFKIYSSGRSIYIQQNDNHHEPALITIFDMLGRELQSGRTAEEQITKLDTQFTGTGYYIVSVKNSKEITTQKVFLQ